MNDYYTPKQIAEKLAVNIYTVRKLINGGDLEAVNLGSKKKPTYRISSESFNKFIDNKSKNYERNNTTN